MTMKYRVGDCVEVNWEALTYLGSYNEVEQDEQGIVIDAHDQSSLVLALPHRTDHFSDGGFYIMGKQLKLVCRLPLLKMKDTPLV